MSASELNEHRGYWNDPQKLRAYTQALDEVVGTSDEVLDLGTGTGMLAILAARAGAQKVWCFDGGDILGLSRELVEANTEATQIEYVQAFTTEAELPEVDVVVCDQIGGLVHDAGVLTYFADAKARALRPGGRMVPAAFDLYLAPVESPVDYQQVDQWGSIGGFDLSAARAKAVNTEYHVGANDLTLCAPGERFASIDSSDDSPIKAQCSWTASRSGTMHGLVGWFDATMSPTVRLTNEPHKPDRMRRWVNFYPVEQPIELTEGDPITGSIDIRPKGHVVSWSVTHHDVRQQQSTFLGQFGSTQQFRGEHSNDAHAARAKRQAIRDVTTALDNGATTDVLVSAIVATGLFGSERSATRFAQQIVRASGATWRR